jgi:hypothetical protein
MMTEYRHADGTICTHTPPAGESRAAGFPCPGRAWQVQRASGGFPITTLPNIYSAIKYAQVAYGSTLRNVRGGIGSGHGYVRGGIGSGHGYMAENAARMANLFSVPPSLIGVTSD